MMCRAVPGGALREMLGEGTRLALAPPPTPSRKGRGRNLWNCLRFESVGAGTPWGGTMTGAAQALSLDRRTADAETGRLRRAREHRRDIVVLHLDDLAALLTDQELRGVGVSVAVVLCAVGDTAGDAKTQTAGRVREPGLAQLVEQVIGAGRRCRIQDHAEDVSAQFRQPGTAMLADGFGAIQQVLGPS